MFEDLPFEVAAVLITRIISIVNNELLCIDVGHKSIASENPLVDRIRLIHIQEYEVISHSEEHIVVKVSDTSIYEVGDVWYATPFHICPTVALHSSLQVIENRYSTDQWKVIARNKQINF